MEERLRFADATRPDRDLDDRRRGRHHDVGGRRAGGRWASSRASWSDRTLFDVYGEHPTIPGYIRRGLAGESFWYTVEVGKAVYDTWLAPLRGPSGEVIGWPACRTTSASCTSCSGTAIQNDRVIALGTLAAQRGARD